jgi:TRAP transporter TAXI family solute receptor
MRFLAAGLSLALCSCTGTADAPPKTYQLNLARTAANQLGEALKRLPNVKVDIVAEGGSSINSLIDLYNGKTDVAVPIADVAYLAYAGQLGEMPTGFDQLRGMSVADLNAIHLLVAPHTRVNSLKELAGRHVSLGPPGSSVALVSERLLRAHDIRSANLRLERIPNAEMIRQLERGHIDAAFTMYQPVNQAVAAAMKSGVRLVAIEGPVIEELRTQYPYLKRTLIQAGTYPNQPNPVRTIGIEEVLVCRADLDEELVYQLMQAYFAAFPAMTPMNLERAPATPVPLHPGAARYYRQRELER